MRQTDSKTAAHSAVSQPEANTQKQGHDRVLRDDIVPQLGRRIRGGRETWVVHCSRAGKVAKITLGACATIPIVRARAMALDLLEEAPTHSPLSGKTALAAFAQIFLDDCAGRWKPKTLHSHRHAMSRHILPGLGDMKIGKIERSDVTAWFNKMNMSKGGRNRALSVLSSLFIHAEIRGLRPPGSNPCAGMRRHDMRFKARYLDADEYAALGRAFAKASVTSPMAVRVFRFCALTGCRKSEALMLRWSMIDGNRAALPDSKSGPKSIWLGRPVRKLIATVPKTGDLVFEIDGEPVCPRMLQRVWDDIRSDLGIPTFRIHDLRHCFASVAVSLGYDLLIVGGLLGHADKGSTAGYAHLSTRDVAAASARVGKHFAKVIAGQQPGKTHKPRRRGSKPDKLIAAFLRSKDTLTAFCASRGLEPETFRREVENWRSVNARLAR